MRAELKRQMRRGLLYRTYLTVVRGRPARAQGSAVTFTGQQARYNYREPSWKQEVEEKLVTPYRMVQRLAGGAASLVSWKLFGEQAWVVGV